MNKLQRLTLVIFTLACFIMGGSIWAAEKHFHPKGKMPSKFTIELQNGLRNTLPFGDERDFEEVKFDIYQMILDQKTDVRIKEWTKALKANAFIDIRL